MGATEVVWPASDKPQGRKSRKKDAGLWGFEDCVVVWVHGVRQLCAPRTSRSVLVLLRVMRLWRTKFHWKWSGCVFGQHEALAG